MKYVFVAPRFHTNYSPIIHQLILENNEVEYLVQYKGFREDYSDLKPEIIKPSFLTIILNKIIYAICTEDKATIYMAKMYIPSFMFLLKYVKNNKPDIIITKNRNILSIFIKYVAKLCRVKNVLLYVQSPLFIEKNDNWIKNLLKSILYPRKIMTVVEYRNYPSPEKKYIKKKNTYFVPFVQFCNPEVETRNYLENDKIHILDVGKYRSYKNHYVLVDAIALLASITNIKDIEVTIVGQASNKEEEIYFEYLSKYINNKGLKNVIKLVKNVDFHQMSEVYMKNDIFVLTSIREVASVSVLEAMSYGLVTISTDANGTASYIKRGQTGDIFKTNDPHSLADILNFYIQGPKNIEKQGQAAYNRVLRLYSPNIYSKHIKSIINGD